MVTQILQQQTDNAGNMGWVLIDSTQTFTDSASALAYLQTLPAGNYMAQLMNGNDSTVLAVI